MLYGEVSVVRAGLAPYFGIVRGSSRDHGSLVFDVIGEYRVPFADRVVNAAGARFGVYLSTTLHGDEVERARQIGENSD